MDLGSSLVMDIGPNQIKPHEATNIQPNRWFKLMKMGLDVVVGLTFFFSVWTSNNYVCTSWGVCVNRVFVYTISLNQLMLFFVLI